MKFLADVNIPQSVITYLTKLGHDVSDLKRIDLYAKDTEVVKLAQKEDRIILTIDKDFISLTQFPKYKVPTIVIRLVGKNPKVMVNKLSELLENQKEETLQKSLTIIRDKVADSHPQ